MATLLRAVVLASLALAGCPEGREAPPASHRDSPEPTAVQQAPPTDSPGAPAQTDVPASPAPAEPVVVVDDGKSAAAMREALAVVRAQTPSPLHAGEALEAFYERRQYRPVFVVGGELSTEASEVVTALRGLSEHGVVVADYDLDGLAASLAPGDVDPNRVELRLLDTWISASARLLTGSVDPTTVHAEWNAPPRERDLVAALTEAVEGRSFAETLYAQAPPQPGYARLREALARYRTLADAGGAWPKLRLGAPLEREATGPKVVALRERLRATGDLEAAADGPFDTKAVAALQAFQTRHGLSPTGALDRDTVRALNVSPSDRAEQIAANLERWRWLPEDLGETHVRVNIAGFTVEAWRAGKRVLAMNAVVGKPYRRTPVFSDSITHVVLNPRWSVPFKLAVNDVLPKIRKDPDFLKKKGFRVFKADTGAPVDADDVPWDELSRRKFGYLLRQEPGANNALGRLKIMFPNPHDIYLHDTPKRHLFKETKRAFSSGCVRLQDPRALAVFLLDDEHWTRARIDGGIKSGREQTLWLAEPVPVHLEYWTAWVDDTGVVHFREDLYGRDARLIAALGETPAP